MVKEGGCGEPEMDDAVSFSMISFCSLRRASRDWMRFSSSRMCVFDDGLGNLLVVCCE